MTARPADLDPLEEALHERTAALVPAPIATPLPSGGTGTLRTIFRAQATSRAVDHAARWLRSRGVGHYTIGSAGHESNAFVAAALRHDDPALLHYRSGGFWFARAALAAAATPDGPAGSVDAVGDVLRGMLARSTEPLAGGRHKVWGSAPLNVVPTTSTIGSHLPRAVGLATAIGQRPDGHRGRFPADAVVMASIGDASLNHTTTQGALNWASNQAHRGLRVPLLLVVEDNGIGISVRTPAGWVEAATDRLPGFAVARVAGTDPVRVRDATQQLAMVARSGRPALLHLRTVRYLGHAGSDVESAYRLPAEMRADLELDPVLATARLLVERHGVDPGELLAVLDQVRAEVRGRALEIADEPALSSVGEVAASISPRDEPAVERRAVEFAEAPSGVAPDAPLTLARSITAALHQVLAATDASRVFGEDVGGKGGVYGVTRGLRKQFGAHRVFDTVLDESSILGLALGAGLDGHLPIPEIQYLAYLHNAEDQLRGEAATTAFFSTGQYRNGMVVRIAGLAYQRGFGGHFHNDDAVGVLTDVPGLVVAVPAHPRDAGPMLRTLAAAAQVDGTVSVLLEPIARYHTTDLHDGDGAWTSTTADQPAHVRIGEAVEHGDGDDLLLVSFGNGTWMARRAATQLAAEGIATTVLDLRWLRPLPVEQLVAAARRCGRVLVVDETRRSGGVGEGVIAELVQHGVTVPMARVSSHDSFVPLGDAADLVLLQEADVLDAARRLVTVPRADSPGDASRTRPDEDGPARPRRPRSRRRGRR